MRNSLILRMPAPKPCLHFLLNLQKWLVFWRDVAQVKRRTPRSIRTLRPICGPNTLIWSSSLLERVHKLFSMQTYGLQLLRLSSKALTWPAFHPLKSNPPHINTRANNLPSSPPHSTSPNTPKSLWMQDGARESRANQVRDEQTQGRRKYTPPSWNPLYVPGSEASMVYTLSGPMVYTLLPRFPKEVVHTIAVFPRKWYTPKPFLVCDLGVGRQSKRGGVPWWWCMLLFPWKKTSNEGHTAHEQTGYADEFFTEHHGHAAYKRSETQTARKHLRLRFGSN